MSKPIVEVPKVVDVVQPVQGADPLLLKLFRLADDCHVQLRFLPDGNGVEGKALLLVVYGYKALRGYTSVSAARARYEVLRATPEAPNAAPIARMLPVMDHLRHSNGDDIGANAFKNRTLRRVRLSEGGFLELTEHGEVEADQLARDLIDRA